MQLPLDDHRVDHRADVVHRAVRSQLRRRRSRDRPPPRRHARRSRTRSSADRRTRSRPAPARAYPADSCAARRLRRATCAKLTARSVPATRNLPCSNSMSAAAASSRCAAIFLPLAMIFAAGDLQRGAAHCDRARAEGAGADRHLPPYRLRRIAMLSIGMPSRDDRICANVVAWPCPWLCVPRYARDAAVRRHAHLRRLRRSRSARPSCRRGARARRRRIRRSRRYRCLAASSSWLLPFRKSGVVRQPPAHARKILGKVAAVVGRPDRRLVRHRLLRNQVAAADLGAIDAELARRLVGKALEHVAGFRTARAAVGVGRHACWRRRR